MNDGVATSTDGATSRRRSRVPYFQRPKPPHDWRWVVGGIGRALIVTGLLMFAFVGYQLWGTGLQTARAQNNLEDQFEEALRSTTTLPTTTTTTRPTETTEPSGSTTSTTSTIPTAASTPPLANGEWIGRLVIPEIGVDWIVVEGVRVDDLKKGPGHFRETPMPGQLGNSAIAGHRTTYGEPFRHLDQLAPGDLILMQTLAGSYTYRVTETLVVGPNDYAQVIPTTDSTAATLTLVTCHPAYTARNRLIVRAELVPEESDQVFAPPSNTLPPSATSTTMDTLPTESGPTESGPTETDPAGTVSETTVTPAAGPSTTVVAIDTADIEDTFAQGWFGDTGAIPQALAWGALLVAIVVGAYFAGKAAGRLYVCFLVGAVPFVVVLYFFFENVNRLLPASL